MTRSATASVASGVTSRGARASAAGGQHQMAAGHVAQLDEGASMSGCSSGIRRVSISTATSAPCRTRPAGAGCPCLHRRRWARSLIDTRPMRNARSFLALAFFLVTSWRPPRSRGAPEQLAVGPRRLVLLFFLIALRRSTRELLQVGPGRFRRWNARAFLVFEQLSAQVSRRCIFAVSTAETPLKASARRGSAPGRRCASAEADVLQLAALGLVGGGAGNP